MNAERRNICPSVRKVKLLFTGSGSRHAIFDLETSKKLPIYSELFVGRVAPYEILFLTDRFVL